MYVKMAAPHFDEQSYRSRLREGRIGRRVIALESVDSTNRLAREVDKEQAPHGTVIVAETQTSGRGRFRRSWASPGGGLWFSLVLRPDAGDPALPSLPLLAGVSLIAALEKAAGEKLRLGWPNDIVHDGKKLAGILVENVFEKAALAVVGIGVNVNNSAGELPPEVADIAVSLRDITGAAHSREALLAGFIGEFEAGYEKIHRDGAGKLLAEWKKKLELTGKTVTLKMEEATYTGTVEDFGPDGKMSLRLEDGSPLDVPLHRGTLISSKYTKHL